jgi:hypothetical protein
MTHALLLAATVVIRSYNYAGVPAEDLANARLTAARIFQQAGIQVVWMDCATRSSIVDRPSSIVDRRSCEVPLREGMEFVLRLQGSAFEAANVSAAVRQVAMGSTVVDHDSGIGAMTTVDPGVVAAVALSASAQFSVLLGRAIAHEIGHLLLGHSRHSRSGLMRAIWSQEELRGIRPAGWQFSSVEAAQMRQGLAGRAHAGN